MREALLWSMIRGASKAEPAIRIPSSLLLFIALTSPGANVRLLGSVIDCAAGALPDKSHANAVEASIACASKSFNHYTG